MCDYWVSSMLRGQDARDVWPSLVAFWLLMFAFYLLNMP